MVLPMIDKVKSSTVWGLGTMGRTWVIAMLMAGWDVFAHEPNDAVRDSALKEIEAVLAKIEKKGKAPPGFAAPLPQGFTAAAMQRLHVVDRAAAVKSGTPIHLECLPEDLKLKLDFFRQLGVDVPAGTVFWTNTSCLDVAKMAEASGRPGLFVGTHGMNPVHLMKGVEVVRTAVVTPEVFDWTMAVLKKMMKTPFPAANVPGFLVNKMLIPFMLDVMRAFWRGETDIVTADMGFQLSLGHPQGVFKLADWIGHDVMILVSDALYEATQDPRFIVPPEYRAMVEAGHLGRKSGRGFYDWTDSRNLVPVALDQLSAAA